MLLNLMLRFCYALQRKMRAQRPQAHAYSCIQSFPKLVWTPVLLREGTTINY